MPGEKKKVILVTGGTGLVGQGIKKVVETEEQREDEKWIFVNSKDANLIDLEETKRLFEKYKPTHVIHLAAKVGGMFYNMAHPLEMFRENIIINDNVLQTSYETGVVKVISCLSTCIYPDEITYPMDENMLHNGHPHPSNFGYTYAKRLLDFSNRGYAEKNRTYTSVIPCNVFGSHDNFNLKSGHCLPAFIHKVYNVMQEGGKMFTVLGSGKPLRQYIYSLDLGRLFIWTLRNYDSVEPLILSVDENDEIPIGEIAKTIADAFQFKGEFVLDSSFPDGQYRKTATNKKLRSLLPPNFKFTPFKQAIQETVAWFKENHDNARL